MQCWQYFFVISSHCKSYVFQNLKKHLSIFVLSRTNLSPIVHVALVSKNHFFYVSTRMLLNVPDPVFDVIETLLVGDIINQHDSHGPPVVSCGYGAKSFLSCCVPNLKFDLLSVQLNCPDFEVNPWKDKKIL